MSLMFVSAPSYQKEVRGMGGLKEFSENYFGELQISSPTHTLSVWSHPKSINCHSPQVPVLKNKGSDVDGQKSFGARSIRTPNKQILILL